jgi:hypothetical protein
LVSVHEIEIAVQAIFINIDIAVLVSILKIGENVTGV